MPITRPAASRLPLRMIGTPLTQIPSRHELPTSSSLQMPDTRLLAQPQVQKLQSVSGVGGGVHIRRVSSQCQGPKISGSFRQKSSPYWAAKKEQLPITKTNVTAREAVSAGQPYSHNPTETTRPNIAPYTERMPRLTASCIGSRSIELGCATANEVVEKLPRIVPSRHADCKVSATA